MPRHDPIMVAASWTTWVIALGLALSGCGKKEAAAPLATRTKAQPSAEKAAPAPKPVDIGMDETRFVAARILERCALAAGESELDGRAMAIDLVAGRPYQPVTLEALKEAIAAAKAAAAAPALPAGATGTAGADKSTGGAMRTPAGRLGPGPSDAAFVGRYEKALLLASKRPDIVAQIDKGATSCLFAPELGRLDPDLIERYTVAFVEITCAAERHRGKDGKVDALAHAQEAGQIFTAQKFTAPEFARIGPIMGRFSGMEKDIYDRRRAQCPDPRETLAREAASGAYEGTFAGLGAGRLKIQAEEGALTGTMTFTGPPADKGGEAQVLKSWRVLGALNGDRVHLLASEDLDWIRLEGKRAGKSFSGGWKAEIGFKKLKGTWAFARPLPAPPAAASPPAAPGPAAP